MRKNKNGCSQSESPWSQSPRSLKGSSDPALPCPCPSLSLPICPTVCLHAAVACVLGASLSLWMVRLVALRCQHLRRRRSTCQCKAGLRLPPSILPSFLPPPPPLVRAPLFGESVFQPLAAATPLPPPTAACNGRTVADSNAVAATLTGRQVSLALQYGALNPTI